MLRELSAVTKFILYTIDKTIKWKYKREIIIQL